VFVTEFHSGPTTVAQTNGDSSVVPCLVVVADTRCLFGTHKICGNADV